MCFWTLCWALFHVRMTFACQPHVVCLIFIVTRWLTNLPVLHFQCFHNLCLLCGITEYCSGFMSLGGSKWRYPSIAHALLMWRSTQCMYYFMGLVYWCVCVCLSTHVQGQLLWCAHVSWSTYLSIIICCLYINLLCICVPIIDYEIFCNFHFTDRRPDVPGTVILFDPALEFIFSNCLASAVFSFVLRTGVWL